MKTQTRLHSSMTISDAATALCKTDTGMYDIDAMAVVTRLVISTGKACPDAPWGDWQFILLLDWWEIYAEDICIMYEYLCGSRIGKMMAALLALHYGLLGIGTVRAAINDLRRLDLDDIVMQLRSLLPNFDPDFDSAY